MRVAIDKHTEQAQELLLACAEDLDAALVQAILTLPAN